MFPKWVNEFGTILLQAFMITLGGWIFVFTCWEVKEIVDKEDWKS